MGREDVERTNVVQVEDRW